MGADNLVTFITVKLFIERLITKFGHDALASVSYVVAASMAVVITTWIMLEGYRILSGNGRESLTSFLWRAGKMVLVVVIVSWITGNSGSFQDWINTHVRDHIATVVAGNENGSPETMVDTALILMQSVMGTMGAMQSSTGTEGSSGGFNAFMVASAVGQGAPAVIGGSLLLLNQIAMSICILTAPFFITCLLFESTKPMFQTWLKYSIGTLFSLAVLSVMVTICLKIVVMYSLNIVGQRLLGAHLGTHFGSGIAQTSMLQGALGLLMSTLMISAPPIASQFFGGMLGQFTGFSPFNSAGGNRLPDGTPVGGGHADRGNSQVGKDNNQDNFRMQNSGATGRAPNQHTTGHSTSNLPQSIKNVDEIKSAKEATRATAKPQTG